MGKGRTTRTVLIGVELVSDANESETDVGRELGIALGMIGQNTGYRVAVGHISVVSSTPPVPYTKGEGTGDESSNE